MITRFSFTFSDLFMNKVPCISPSTRGFCLTFSVDLSSFKFTHAIVSLVQFCDKTPLPLSVDTSDDDSSVLLLTCYKKVKSQYLKKSL